VGLFSKLLLAGAILAVMVFFLRKPLKRPFTVAGWVDGCIFGLMIGAVLGAGLMYTLGYHWSPQPIVIQPISGPPMGGVAGGQSYIPTTARPSAITGDDQSPEEAVAHEAKGPTRD
jgi:Na+/citrate or Na+/malate symporter